MEKLFAVRNILGRSGSPAVERLLAACTIAYGEAVRGCRYIIHQVSKFVATGGSFLLLLVVTKVAILATDLLTGVLVGTAVGLFLFLVSGIGSMARFNEPEQQNKPSYRILNGWECRKRKRLAGPVFLYR